MIPNTFSFCLRALATVARENLAVLVIFSLALFAVLMPSQAGCTKQQGQIVGQTAKDVGVKVAQDVCAEVASDAGVDPALITLICKDGINEVKVLLPRKAWLAMKASSLDAGGGI
jgi:hypothetical protein